MLLKFLTVVCLESLTQENFSREANKRQHTSSHVFDWWGCSREMPQQQALEIQNGDKTTKNGKSHGFLPVISVGVDSVLFCCWLSHFETQCLVTEWWFSLQLKSVKNVISVAFCPPYFLFSLLPPLSFLQLSLPLVLLLQTNYLCLSAAHRLVDHAERVKMKYGKGKTTG